MSYGRFAYRQWAGDSFVNMDKSVPSLSQIFLNTLYLYDTVSGSPQTRKTRSGVSGYSLQILFNEDDIKDIPLASIVHNYQFGTISSSPGSNLGI